MSKTTDAYQDSLIQQGENPLGEYYPDNMLGALQYLVDKYKPEEEDLQEVK